MINFVTTFLLLFSVLILVRFSFNLLISIFANPPKKYEFKNYEGIFYMFLLSYILTFLIMI